MTTDQVIALSVGDDERVLVRPLDSSDADRLEHGFDRLSTDSRYSRFFGPKPDLGAEMLDRFVRPDQVDHVAIGAATVDPRTSREGQGLGVARAFRSDDRPTEAEFAVTVIDEAQGLGVGSLLLDLLGAGCADVGVTRLTAHVLSTNRAMLAMVRGRAGEVRSDPSDASVSLVRLDTETLARRLEPRDRAGIERLLATERRERAVGDTPS